MKITLDGLICGECGNPLNIHSEPVDGKMVFKVDPCEVCMQGSKQDGANMTMWLLEAEPARAIRARGS